MSMREFNWWILSGRIPLDKDLSPNESCTRGHPLCLTQHAVASWLNGSAIWTWMQGMSAPAHHQ